LLLRFLGDDSYEENSEFASLLEGGNRGLSAITVG